MALRGDNTEKCILARCAYCDYISYESIVQKHIRDSHENHCDESVSESQETEVYDDPNFNNDDISVTNVITDAAEDENKYTANHVWNDAEIKLLICLYEQHKSEFERKKYTNKSIWQRISAEMNKNDSIVTWEQCDNKLKNLKKSYKKIVDNNSRTGRGKMNFKYFDLMDSLLKTDPAVYPVSECRSMTEDSNATVSTGSRCSTPLSSVDSDCTETSKIIKKRPRSDNEPIWFKKFREDADRRHRERMQLQERFVSVIENLLSKD